MAKVKSFEAYFSLTLKHGRITQLVFSIQSEQDIFTFSLQKVEEWRTVFWVTFVIYFVGMLLFCMLMSADLQPWATGDASSKQEENEDVGMDEQS